MIEIANVDKTDWSSIHSEYIGGGTTYRRLAKKYGVGLTTLATRASEEGWKRDKEIAAQESRELAIQRTAERAAANSEKLEYARSLMIDRVLQALEKMPEGIGNRVRQSQKDEKTGKQMTVDYDILKLVSALEKLSNVSASSLSRQMDFEEEHDAEAAHDTVFGNDTVESKEE